MNIDQVMSLVRSLLKVFGTALATHGMTKAAGVVNAEDTVGLVMTILGFIWSHQKHRDPEDKQSPGVTPLLLFLVPLLVVGCHSARLEQGGAYAPGSYTVLTDVNGVTTTNFVASQAPDLEFYQVDSAFEASYQTLKTVFAFERNNRASLWKVSPEIKHQLDKIRPTAWQAVKDYARVRAEYVAHPAPAGLTTLRLTLVRVQSLANGVSAALSQTK